VFVRAWVTGSSNGPPWAVGVTKVTSCGNTQWSTAASTHDTSGGEYRVEMQMQFPEVNFCSHYGGNQRNAYQVTWRVAWSHE
jgi:hypothetical protein